MNEEKQRAMIEEARKAAFPRIAAALMQVEGSVPPRIPPKRGGLGQRKKEVPAEGDPHIVARTRARDLAKQFFNWPRPNMEQIAEILREMMTHLQGPNFQPVIVKADDKRCRLGAGFTAVGVGPIHLCPLFFSEESEEGIAPRAEQRIRTLIHESAHRSGIGNPDREAYYQAFDGNPRTGVFGDFDMADAWGHYVHILSGQPKDPPAAKITPRSPPGTTPPRGIPPTTTPKRIHEVVYGDYLTKLAQIYYGNPQLWRKIYDANRAVIGPDPNKIYPGQKLVIP